MNNIVKNLLKSVASCDYDIGIVAGVNAFNLLVEDYDAKAKRVGSKRFKDGGELRFHGHEVFRSRMAEPDSVYVLRIEDFIFMKTMERIQLNALELAKGNPWAGRP